MPEKERFMEAVAAKVGAKRKPMMKRKGGPSIIIAIGAPKPAPMGDKPEMVDEEDGQKVDHSKMSKAEHIAYLQEKIASLKAELALLEDEDEMDDESAMADEQEYEDEDED